MRKILSRLNRLSKRIIFFFSAIIVAILGIFIYGYLHSTSTQAAWFDDSWAYRKAVTLTDSAAETNKYAALSSYDASDTTKYQADCGDVRFTDQNGKLLVYTVTSCGASTTFNINIPSILNGTQTIYLYYGNPSVSNGFASSDPYTACATCSFGSPASEEKSEGPVGYWKFDDSTGQTTQDSTINNNDGTLGADSGSSTDDPTWTAEDQCVSGKCLKFDGGDYIKVGDASALNFSSTGAFSISTWIKTGTATGEIMVDSWIASAANNAYAFYTSSGTLKVAVSTMATNSQWDSVTGTTAVNDNKWHYVTLVYNNKTANLYVDGKLDVSEALTVGDATLSTDTYGVLMGANFNTNNSTFTTYQTGYLDEVKIYPYARSAAQIAWDYNRGGPVGWWKFDECQGTTAYDNSGNANNGTITIGASGEDTVGTCTTSSTAWGSGATGKFNSSLSFDGSDDYVSMASNIASYSSGSMMAWINSSGTYTGRQTVMGGVAASGADATARFLITMVESTGGTCSGNQWYTVIANGTTSQTVCSGQVYNSTNFPASTWTHVAITYDGSNVRFYKNGVLVNTVAQTASGAGAAQPFSIGRIGGWNGYYYQGGIDDARIYNYALTGTQIKNLYNGGFGIRFGPATGSP